MDCLIIKEILVLEILKREIPKLFSEEAQKLFDFEELQFSVINDNGQEVGNIQDVEIVISAKRDMKESADSPYFTL